MLVYRLAVTIYDGTVIFCDRWVDKKSRTHDQMIQAARSGKQNIGEGSKELSIASDILLNSVSRSSYTELAEDYEDFLRLKDLSLLHKDDSSILKIRAFREVVEKPTDLANLAKWANLNLDNPEDFANFMICLCYKQGYLMDQFLRSKEKKFIVEGGFKENLYKKRREYKDKLKANWSNWTNLQTFSPNFHSIHEIFF